MYDLEQGKTEEAILRQCVNQRVPIPDAIANAPELGVGLELFLHAYLELCSCRVQDGPIPYIAIVQYCEIHEISDELADELLYIVRRMDVEISAYRADKAEARAKATAKNRTRGNGK